MSSIYIPTSRNDSTDFYNFDGFDSKELDSERSKAQEKNMNSYTPIKTKDVSGTNNGTAAKGGSTDNQANGNKPNNNVGNEELTPTDSFFAKDINKYIENSSESSDIAEWNGLGGEKNENAIKIFALNNWSMSHWNIGNDEIS